MRFSAKRHFLKANKAKEDGSTVLFRFQWKESKNPMVVFDLSVQNECQTDGEPRKNDERNGSLIPQGNKNAAASETPMMSVPVPTARPYFGMSSSLTFRRL